MTISGSAEKKKKEAGFQKRLGCGLGKKVRVQFQQGWQNLKEPTSSLENPSLFKKPVLPTRTGILLNPRDTVTQN